MEGSEAEARNELVIGDRLKVGSTLSRDSLVGGRGSVGVGEAFRVGRNRLREISRCSVSSGRQEGKRKEERLTLVSELSFVWIGASTKVVGSCEFKREQISRRTTLEKGEGPD
jgi:hypothetical protein